MGILRYRDPTTGEWTILETGGGPDEVVISETEPTNGAELWVNLSLESGGGGSGGGGGEIRVFTFDTPADHWKIYADTLIGSVVVVDSAGTVVEPGTITHAGTTADLYFSAPFSGTAYVVCN